MEAWKLNLETNEYMPYDVPDGALDFSFNKGKPCQCAGCGKWQLFKDMHESRIFKNAFGMGYAVCDSCSNSETTELTQREAIRRLESAIRDAATLQAEFDAICESIKEMLFTNFGINALSAENQEFINIRNLIKVFIEETGAGTSVADILQVLKTTEKFNELSSEEQAAAEGEMTQALYGARRKQPYLIDKHAEISALLSNSFKIVIGEDTWDSKQATPLLKKAIYLQDESSLRRLLETVRVR